MSTTTATGNSSRIRLLHVGGTIGMSRGEDGYVPTEGVVERYLRSVADLVRPELPAFELRALPPLLDSANMRPADWGRIASAIVEDYDDFDGFVVLHGTDTMVYTASALSFLLPGLGKPVLLTGAQLPLENVRSDGREHLVTSLILASELRIPEVTLYFGNRLMRGNRAQKVHNHEFVAFASGNLPPLARVGVRIDVEHHLVRAPGDVLRPVALKREPIVVAVRVFPGLTPVLLRQMLSAPIEGVVLETYGTGTFPSADPELLAAVRDACERGVVVVNTSQCHSGRVRQELYGTAVPLARAGVVSGHDMTPEAALTKLYCLLGAGHDVDDVRRLMETDLAGELDAN